MKKYNVKVDAEQCNGDQEKMIKRFIEKVKKSGVLDEIYERRFYEKPSEKKRRKKRESEKRIKREQSNT